MFAVKYYELFFSYIVGIDWGRTEQARNVKKLIRELRIKLTYFVMVFKTILHLFRLEITVVGPRVRDSRKSQILFFSKSCVIR